MMIRLRSAYVLIALHLTLFTPASGSHMVEFILTNRHIRNVEFDSNATLWFEKFDDRCNSSFIIHGWKNSARDHIFEHMADMYNFIPDQCFNTVRVNWPDAMRDDYSSAVSAIRQVAEEVAMFIRRMQRLGLLRKVELVGFSLGAHLAGLTGRTLAQYLGSNDLVSEIVALDPAGPGFTDFFMTYYEDRLLPTDARNVLVLHTNTGCSGTSKSHHKALEYFIESLTSNAFIGMNANLKPAMFGRGRNMNTEAGDYYFKTNLASPFARG